MFRRLRQIIEKLTSFKDKSSYQSSIVQDFHKRWGFELTFPESSTNDWKQKIINEASSVHQANIKILTWEKDWQNDFYLDIEVMLKQYPETKIVIEKIRHTYFFPFNDSTSKFIAFHFRDNGPDFIGLDFNLYLDLVRYKEAYTIDGTYTDEIRRDPDLLIPLRFVAYLEEMAHCLDNRLQSEQSPYASNGDEWQRVECSKKGVLSFSIPNRKDYNRVIEDWASTVVWYVFRPEAWPLRNIEGNVILGTDGSPLLQDGLKEHDKARYDFAENCSNSYKGD